MKDEIKEILDKLSNRKQETLIQGLRECQLKDIEHPFITKEEYIDKILDYITNLQTIEQQYSAILSENAELENKITNLQEENKELKNKIKNNERCRRKMQKTLQQRIDKAVEYLTSYESIETIQQCEHSDNNKSLDEKTFNEMTRRYLIVHDKLLNILEESDKE